MTATMARVMAGSESSLVRCAECGQVLARREHNRLDLLVDEPTPMPVREYRCYCGWLLFKGRLVPGSAVQLKCRGCREIVTIVAAED